MIIQVDSREKARAIKKIEAEFDRQGIKHPISKLIVGDYVNYDNPRVIIDRKQNLAEVCSNLIQQHERFRNEALLAKDLGITLIILVEDGVKVKSLADVEHWINPRRYQYCKAHGIPTRGDVEAEIAEFERHGGTRQPTPGPQLARTMRTMSERYGIIWEFCSKSQTGKRIVEILRDGL